MTEFYMNYSKKDIDIIINKKMQIYADSYITILLFHGQEIDNTHFIYKGAENFSGISNFKLYEYIGIHRGVYMYHFCNIITQ